MEKKNRLQEAKNERTDWPIFHFMLRSSACPELSHADSLVKYEHCCRHGLILSLKEIRFTLLMSNLDSAFPRSLGSVLSTVVHIEALSMIQLAHAIPF